MIEIMNIVKIYKTGEIDFKALDNVSLKIPLRATLEGGIAIYRQQDKRIESNWKISKTDLSVPVRKKHK